MCKAKSAYDFFWFSVLFNCSIVCLYATDVRQTDVRQTDVRQHHHLMPLGGGITTCTLWLECDATIPVWCQFIIWLDTNSLFGTIFGTEENMKKIFGVAILLKTINDTEIAICILLHC